LADGIETLNVIKGNLIVNPRSSHTMYQTDVRAAGIYISHPNNDIENNHVAGSEFDGFTFEFVKYPTGASITTNICP